MRRRLPKVSRTPAEPAHYPIEPREPQRASFDAKRTAARLQLTVAGVGPAGRHRSYEPGRPRGGGALARPMALHHGARLRRRQGAPVRRASSAGPPRGGTAVRRPAAQVSRPAAAAGDPIRQAMPHGAAKTCRLAKELCWATSAPARAIARRRARSWNSARPSYRRRRPQICSMRIHLAYWFCSTDNRS